jgi:serine/threonine-protein kinase
MTLSSGDIIDGKYRIIRLIGEGGMGAVYEGENVRIHRRVAIKVLHSGIASNQDAVQRFEREAQAAGRIGSEHIVEVLDLGNLPDGDRYMVMEFLEGDTLSGRIHARGRLTPRELVPIFHQVLEGLAAAHGAGIIHRDLKPENVFLLKSRKSQHDFVKLLDFGISKFNQLSGESGFSMTRTGAVMGTPYYMSPEQAKGAKGMDHRADLYAVGVMLYEGVTGQVPFNADTFNELLFKIVLEEPKPIEHVVPEVDPSFAAIVRRAMARDPSERFQSAQDFQTAVDGWAHGVPVEAPAQHTVPVNPVAPRPAQTPSTLGTGTPGSWSSNSYSGVAPVQAAPKKGLALLIAAAGAIGLAVIGGVVFVAMKSSKAPEADTAAQVAAAPPPVDTAAQERAAVEKALAEKAAADKAAAEKAAAEKAAAEKAELAQKPAESTPRTSREPVSRRTATVSRTTTTAKEGTAKTETAPPKPPPTTTGTTSTSGGRKIRTQL